MYDEDQTRPLYAGQMHNQAPAPEARRGSTWRWIGWLMGMATIGAVFGFAIIAILKYVDGPAVATSGPTLHSAQASVAPSAIPANTTNMFSGEYVGFAYPVIFDSIGQVKTDAQAFEQYNIGSKDNYHHQVSVNVRPLPSGQLADDASYRLRQIQSDMYKPTTVQVSGEPVAVMAKADKLEQVMFWAHQGKLLTVAVTSSDPKDDVAVILKGIMESARWRK